MAEDHRLPPSAACLAASMRDLGYSLETAVADLIDNSISAEATTVDIVCEIAVAVPYLAILDNGRGMSRTELIDAMKHGSASPKTKRGTHDLGRFGLGLKTASFSQCRSLTVVSLKKGDLSGAEWNLDRIDREDDWILSILNEQEIAALQHVDQLADHGTVVIWRELDRLFEDESGGRRDEIVNEKLDVVERHLGLVFHRFLSGEVKGRKRIAITLNGHAVQPFDPFCRKNTATRHLPEDYVTVDGETVTLQPYILPHHSNLTASEYDFYQSRSDFISNQGAYIYRNGRLMAWGDWFRLIPKGEATKLARVQIDFPNSLDEAWTIDIKKSRARPPLAVRKRLKQIIGRVIGASTTVHRGRGQKLFDEVIAPVWERYADQGSIRYAVNSGHPLIEELRSRLCADDAKLLGLVLEAIGSAIPVEMIYSDYSLHPREMSQTREEKLAVLERLRALRNAFSDSTTIGAGAFREIVRSTHLFDSYMDLAEKFIAEEFV
uniref:ATP-binding protein n=1 Tax=Rhodopseudomonas palustris (strain BisA53) TaxID=316055 RepID=Q07LJ8_RHOP5